MMRIIYSGLFLILFLGITTQSSFAMAEVKSSVVVNSATVTLGDLLENLDRGNNIRVTDSPAPGKEKYISTSYLVRLTKQYNVYWRNSRAVRQITVIRKSRTIKRRDLKPLIEQELTRRKLIDNNTIVHFIRRDSLLYLPEQNSINDVVLKKLTFTQGSRRFAAVVALPEGNDRYTTTVLRGSIQSVNYVPALNKIINPGQQITEQDITLVAVESNNIGRNIIRNKDQIIGMTPRHRLNISLPLRLNDLTRPRMVTRGKMVSILFRSGRINLTAIGKASENGARGDVIRVINSTSRKKIEAMVIGPNQVQVMTLQNSLTQINNLAQIKQPL